MSLIRKVAVLGSGVMGSGIAAHVANAGIPVLMLDMVPPEAGPGEDRSKKSFRNKFALTGLANLKKLRPAPLFTPAALELIEVGNFDDDLQRIAELQGRGPAFRKSFLVTHFFNPVRYMKLLELVSGPDTEPGVLARMARFGEETLGKGIVWAKDSTNFIANRIGTDGMLRVLKDMQKADLAVIAHPVGTQS